MSTRLCVWQERWAFHWDLIVKPLPWPENPSPEEVRRGGPLGRRLQHWGTEDPRTG